MAKQMDYTTSDGVNHPVSYWRPVQLNFNLDGSGLITFLGYHSLATRLAGAYPIDSHQYPINGAQMLQYFAAANYVNGANPTSQAYLLADSVLDTGLDSNGANGHSFFSGASDV